MNVPFIRTGALPVSRGKRAIVKAQNRRVILDAARHVFAELGYEQTTVRDIVRATSLASGTFYNYFKSKEAVFEALRDETAATLRPLSAPNSAWPPWGLMRKGWFPMRLRPEVIGPIWCRRWHTATRTM